MDRSWTDDIDRLWTVELDVPDDPGRADRGDTVLFFDREGSPTRSIDVLGPMQEVFHDLSRDDLQIAFEGAGAGEGLVLVDESGKTWWVHGPGVEPLEGSWTVMFTDGVQELTHGGALRDDPEHLSEDELLQLLDELRGRVLEPLDMKGK
jgi:hypothetical protein